MADQEWTVKDLMEALKRFPLEAKVYYEMGPNGPGTMGQAQYVKVWRRRNGSAAGPINPALSVFGHGSRRSPHSLHSAGLCRTSWATSHTRKPTLWAALGLKWISPRLQRRRIFITISALTLSCYLDLTSNRSTVRI